MTTPFSIKAPLKLLKRPSEPDRKSTGQFRFPRASSGTRFCRHIDKKARQQYEIRTHKPVIDIVQSTAKTIEALNKLSLPAGVDIKIKATTRH